LNYKTDGKYIDVALPERKIAIEYDGWYWHKDKQDKDSERIIELLDDGWKVLVIKSAVKTPDKQTLNHFLLNLFPDTPYKEIVLQDWGGAV
jgi:very-short-patch-repair endonuclease